MILAAFLPVSAFDDLRIPYLPGDEEEALQMLEEGTLDPDLWNEFGQFYTAPISVPRGELALLQELFFNLPDDLPVSAEKLRTYEPWSEEEQKRFFKNFPELEPFSPLLSFETPASASFPAQASFFFSRRGMRDTSRQYARFSAEKEHALKTAGRVDFTDAFGRWQRRVITGSPKKDLRIDAGNYASSLRQKLFLGFFPDAGARDSLPGESWLYPAARTWNGVRIKAQTPRHKDKTGLSGEMALHDRPTERAAFGEGVILINRYFSLAAGGSFLQIKETPGDRGRFYPHGAFLFNIGNGWKGSLLAGAADDEALRLPWLFTLNNQSDGNRFRSTLVFLPRGMYAPRSQMVQSANPLSSCADTVAQDMISAGISFTHRYSPFFFVSPDFTGIFTDQDLAYLRASIGCGGSVPFSYRLHYSWLPDMGKGRSDAQRHQATASATINAGVRTAVVFMSSSTITSEGYWRNRLFVSPSVTLSRALVLSPLAILSGTAGASWKRRIGVKQVMTLQEKTFTEFSVEQDVPFYSWERLRAYGKMSFSF
ncbi:MAG: hypothetical protein JXA71_20450 [Chitinispirillaceae bacterium]|nr:hypothetical protein [Chitinispirillaceae bacterium]